MKNLLLITILIVNINLYAQDYEQVSVTNGFYAGLALGSTGWSSAEFSNDELLTGFAFNLEAGFGFNEKISAFARFEFGPKLNSGSPLIDKYPANQFELGVRWHFGSSTKPLRPFFQLTGSQYSISYFIPDEFGFLYNVDASGLFIGVGGGVRYFIHPAFSLSAQIQADFGGFGLIEIEGVDTMESYSAYTLRFNVGGALHFGGI